MKYCHVKVHGCGDTIVKHCLFFFPFFSWEGAWVLYIMCIGANYNTNHSTFTVNSFWESQFFFLCSCNYTVILQRILKLSGSIISFLVYITMPWSKPVLKAHAVKAKIGRYYWYHAVCNIREIEFITTLYGISLPLSPACSPTA